MKYIFPIFLTGIVCLISFGAEIAPDATVHFDSALLKTPFRYRFQIPNSADKPVEVSSVEVSCNCLNIMTYTGVIPADSAGTLDALFVPDRTGQVEYTITVEFSAASARSPYIIHFFGWVAPADGSGRAGDVSYYSLIPFARIGKLMSPDASCYIAPDDPALKQAVFVDVRSESAYQDGHIQGALNIPSYALEGKEFLKKQTVVLVDDGYGLPALEQRCRSLRDGGFSSISILRGGIRGWTAHGGKLDGLGLPGGGVEIDIGVFRSLQRVQTTLVVYTGVFDKKVEALLSGSVQVSADDPVFREQVMGLMKERGAQQIILVNEDGRDYTLARKALAGTSEPQYCLKSGLNGYVQSLFQRERLVERRTVTTTYSTASGEGSHSSKSNRLVQKGCGCGK